MGIVVVTHELGSINTIADRAVMLARGGHMLSSGTLEEVRADPAREVQAFFRRESMADDASDGLLDRLEVPS
jgi:ABC-type transporter Mla maintaining outer membrane lipid asymmetry ATPase subunit MlaF